MRGTLRDGPRRRAEQYMAAKLWVSIVLAVGVLWSGTARAQVSIDTNPIDVGNVAVGGMGSNTGKLSSATNGVSVDITLMSGTCTGGAGTFTLSTPQGLTGVNLNSAVTVTVQYQPTARGTQTCTVNVYSTGMTTMPLLSFTVKGTGVAPVIGTVPAATYTYPAVRYNDAAATHTAALSLTISNSSTDAGQSLVVNSITFNTGQTTDYTVTSGTLPATIAPGGSAPFTITFDPAAAGASATSMIINSTDPITPNKTITLSGTGATGVIAVTDIPFPTVTQGSSSTQNITITNIGTGTRGPLVVSSALFMNNTAGWFKFNIAGCAGTTTPCTFASPFSITTGSATLPIMCSPPANASGSQSAMVIFTSDTDDATDSVANLTCTAGRADLTVDQTPLAFGNQLLNTTSTGQNVLIGNAGNQALTYSLSLVGTDATQFQVTGIAGCTTNCTMAAAAMGNIGVAFRPTTVGMKSASLRVTASNDPDTTFLDVPLSGTGVAPDSVLSATSLAFGSIDVGDTATAQTVMVTNNGTYPLTINAAFLATGAADYLTTGTTGTSVSITVQPSQSTSWTVACKPSTFGSRPGTFRITSNTGGVPNTNQDIPLTCTGLQGILAIVTPPANPYDFGGVREGDTVSQTWQLKNNGNTPVTNITVAFTGTGTGYMVTPTSVASLAAGASTTVTATFHPLDGTYGGVYIATYSGGWGNAKTTMTTLSLNGDGLTTGYDTMPSAPNILDFGDVRFDQFKLMYVSIINNAGTALQIRGASITPGTAQTGEFTISRCLKNNVAFTCPTMAAPYNSSGVNDTIVLEIRFDPNNRVAMMDATLTVTSDLPTNPDRMLTLKGNSITAGLALNPATMVLDFGPTDLDKVPVSVTRTITLTNTGAAPLDITSVTKIGGPLGNVRFTFGATTAPATVAPNGTYNIDVTYTPTIEKASNQPDTGSIVFGGVNGVFGGMASITIQLTGYGVDRHIALAPVPAFPDTFKNPDPPPTRPVTITNNGDATLNVSAVMVTNDPIWTIVNPDPVSVPGRGMYDFNVAFAPDTIGKAPTGHMTIMNNDNGMPLVAVDLNGNAVDRNVAVGPGTIDLGYVGIGMSVRLSDLAPSEVLTVANAETGTDFPIKKIDIVGGNGAFAVETLDGNALPQPDTGIVLRASSSAQFDVVFTPNAEGDFSADAVVYLGSDPQHLDPRPAVRLVGRGLYVNTGGGGGCSTGRGNGIAMILVVVALVLGRRRRGVLVALVCVGGVARADQSRDVSLALFDPTPAATIGSTFQLQSPEVADKGSLGFFSLVSYANKPLVLATSQNDDAAVENRTTLALGGAYAFGAFELGLRMPLYVQSGAALPTGQQRLEMFGVAPGGTARGDVTASGKYQIGARDNVSYGLAGALTLPTASKDQFAGNSLPTGRAVFLLALVKGPLTATLNAGGVVRAKAQLGSATQGSGGVFGAGLSWRATDNLWLAGEIYGELIPGGQSGQPATGQPMGAAELGKPIEGLLGLRYQMARTTNLGLAVGRGVTADLGAPALRGVLTLTYAPSATDLKPLHPPRPPEPMKDADGDGIADKADGCPNEPEDKDLFDDADGCPDPDNDGDGIPDATDKCPLDAEDKDHFKDDDGCPEKDNDNDGVPDSSDKCPLVAEDKDGFEDTDGCPDPDNDGDGILDKVDKCPAEPETINGNNDDDGCPDKGNALIVLSPDRLELLESVQFSGTKITKASNNVLGQIGATLRAHPEIVRVRLTAHVQPTSNPAADKTLSESRAKAARDWLVDWGIDPLRLQAAGFGGTKPLVDPQSRGAAGINDRFEVIILERK